jgi:hypothetical protein
MRPSARKSADHGSCFSLRCPLTYGAGRRTLAHPMKPAIARFWTRADGSKCLLYKRDDSWWLTIERDGQIVKELALPSPGDAVGLARQWKKDEDKPA